MSCNKFSGCPWFSLAVGVGVKSLSLICYPFWGRKLGDDDDSDSDDGNDNTDSKYVDDDDDDDSDTTDNADHDNYNNVV